MTKYVVELNEEDYQMIKDCHSKNPSLMKAVDEAKKVEKQSASQQRTCGKLTISPDWMLKASGREVVSSSKFLASTFRLCNLELYLEEA